MMEHKKPFNAEIVLDSPLQLEVLEAAIDELHAIREAVGIDADSVEVMIISTTCNYNEAIAVRMKEVNDDAQDT